MITFYASEKVGEDRNPLQFTRRRKECDSNMIKIQTEWSAFFQIMYIIIIIAVESIKKGWKEEEDENLFRCKNNKLLMP